MPSTSHCSFCKHAASSTRRLIAGPGVFICEECVTLCARTFSSEIDPSIPKVSTASDDQVLAVLPRIAATAEEVQRELARRVHHLRGHDVGWDRIGAALGVTAEKASARFGATEG